MQTMRIHLSLSIQEKYLMNTSKEPYIHPLMEELAASILDYLAKERGQTINIPMTYPSIGPTANNLFFFKKYDTQSTFTFSFTTNLSVYFSQIRFLWADEIRVDFCRPTPMQMLTSFQPVILQPVRCGSSEGKGHVSTNKGDVKGRYVCM